MALRGLHGWDDFQFLVRPRIETLFYPSSVRSRFLLSHISSCFSPSLYIHHARVPIPSVRILSDIPPLFAFVFVFIPSLH